MRICSIKVLNIGKDLVCPTRIAIQSAATDVNFGYKQLNLFNVCSKKMQPLLSNKNNIGKVKKSFFDPANLNFSSCPSCI